MEELQDAYRSAMSQAAKLGSLASSIDKTKGVDTATSYSSSGIDQSRLLLARPPRNVVSLWTCSKLCALCFVAGIFAGYTLKRRVKRWASKLLRKLKDD